MEDPVAQHKKMTLAMRYWLLGRNYNLALNAMEFAKNFHTGNRKDGKTPEFAHQIFMANTIRTILPSIRFKEESMAAVFLHDLCEDYDIGFEEINARFGDTIAVATKLLTKKHRGQKIPYETYFEDIGKNPISSIVKAADRAHNILTMNAAGWSTQKQENYLDEVTNWFLPMIKNARRRFPDQEPAFENLKTLLTVQMAHIRLTLNAQNSLA